jgi:hypothetical protein
MAKFLWKSLLASPAVLGAALVVSGNALAVEPTAPTFNADATEAVSVDELTSSGPIQLAQVTSVSELSDVQPTDWAYTALQRLVEEYGCIEGYPDRTYRGNRALTRYEFAAGLNACLDVVVQLIGSLDTTELDTIKRLQEEFAAELATLRGRVDVLEADVAELQANQFSTTTKLNAQLDAHLVIPFDSPRINVVTLNLDETTGAITPAVDSQRDTSKTTFEYRTRLNFDTSFTGTDRLRVRLQASDSSTNPRAVPAMPGGLANASSPTRDNLGIATEDGVKIDDLYYTFSTGDRLSWTIAANGMQGDDWVSSTIVPFDGPGVADFSGPETYDLLGGENQGFGNTFGAGVNIAFSDNFILDAGYSTAEGNQSNKGIFEDAGWIVQLNYLGENFQAAVNYLDTTGNFANQIDSVFTILANFSLGGFNVGGYYGFVDGADDSWQVGIAYDDLLTAGTEAGIYVGESTISEGFVGEAYVDFPVNEFLSVAPSIMYSENTPGITGNAGTGWYGVIRTTFRY